MFSKKLYDERDLLNLGKEKCYTWENQGIKQ